MGTRTQSPHCAIKCIVSCYFFSKLGFPLCRLNVYMEPLGGPCRQMPGPRTLASAHPFGSRDRGNGSVLKGEGCVVKWLLRMSFVEAASTIILVPKVKFKKNKQPVNQKREINRFCAILDPRSFSLSIAVPARGHWAPGLSSLFL